MYLHFLQGILSHRRQSSKTSLICHGIAPRSVGDDGSAELSPYELILQASVSLTSVPLTPNGKTHPTN